MSDTVSAMLDGFERKLHRWGAGANHAAAVWAFRAFPGLAVCALQADTASFLEAPPRFFSLNVRELDRSLNDDLLELYGQAGQLLANRFAFFNSPQTFHEGINWEPHQTPRWREELHACDYVLPLAATFRISCEEKYARHLRYLIAAWIAANPPIEGTGWQQRVVARRIRNWMLAADLARSDWEREPEFRDLVGKSLAQQTAFLLGQPDSLASPDERLNASRAFLCAGRFFTGKKARTAIRRGFELLVQALESAPAEPWPQARLMRAQALLEWNLLAEAGEYRSFVEPRLKKALDELEWVLAPDGCLPLLGPKARLAQDEVEELAALAAVRTHLPVWKSLAGKFGIMPYLLLGERGKAHFERLEAVEWNSQNTVQPDSEILRVVNSGNSAAMISAAPRGLPDGHDDLGSYELAIHQHRVIVDSGSFAPEQIPYFPLAQAHNVLLVDGRSLGVRDGARSAVPDFREIPGGGVRLRLAFSGFECPEIHYHRAWFTTKRNDWLILDWLQGLDVHDCTSLIHFYPTFEITTENDRSLARSRSATFGVIPVSGDKPVACICRGDQAPFPSWYSPEFGVKFPTSVLALTWQAVELPWMGGMLITDRAEEPFAVLEVLPAEGIARVELGGNIYRFDMS